MNVVLKLSKLCNLRCVYCYEYDALGDPARMPLAGLGRFFESLSHYYRSCGANSGLSFAFHGGEPLLLPHAYLRAIVALQERWFGAHGIPYFNAVQTNLYRVPAGTLELLEELGIGVGVSLDVHGGQRVDASGRDAEVRVQANLRRLIEQGWARRVKIGGISVLHARNVDRAADTFRFFAELGLNYRILPIFSMAEPPARMRDLMISPGQVRGAFQAVLDAQLSWDGPVIRVYPLQDYLVAAAAHVNGRAALGYDDAAMEWALIVDTGGDAYGHAEAYSAAHRLGNVFRETVDAVMASAARQRLRAERAERARLCDDCEFGRSCDRIPLVEALPSERTYGADGRLACAVARPMIGSLASLAARVPAVRRAFVEGSTG